MKYAFLSAKKVADIFNVNPGLGISEKEAQRRLLKYGKNTMGRGKRFKVLFMFLRQFNDPLVWILITALFISGVLLSEWADAIAIAVILILNAVLGFVQEYRADKALQSLKKLTMPYCKVLRDGKIVKIPTEDVVPGDIVLVEAGDKIPADGRLIESIYLRVDESSLTGESVPVDKIIKPLKKKKDYTIGDLSNMVFAGTNVVKGRGKFIVTQTGLNTEIGKIKKLLEEEGGETPLQKELKTLGKKLLVVCLGASALVFGLGIVRNIPVLEMFLVAISLAVASIPEGLPAAVTISLALGIKRMAEKNAIVKKLHAVETLGCTTIICTDKTGTVTENKMRVEKVVPVNNKEDFLVNLFVLCNDSIKDSKGKYMGDPTEIALIVYAEKKGKDFEKIRKKFPRVKENPFDSDRKMMSTLHKYGKKYLLVAKGAPEKIISLSSFVGDERKKFSEKQKKLWLEKYQNLSAQGYRCLGFAYKIISHLIIKEKNLIFAGLVAEVDPPRKEVKDAIEKCISAGIKVSMITGDYPFTARAIAERVGIKGDIITGYELENMDEEKLKEKLKKVRIYARVSPEHKHRIVKILKMQEEIVAMTGDGVNDAPALKLADIGVAMGERGTDVAIEASDMILTDDNFATIVNAVEEGRGIFENIRKFVHFLISCNLSEVLTMVVASVIGMPIPLLPIQILWMNLITDGLPALALGNDPPSENLMAKPPRSKKEGILNFQELKNLLIYGIFLSIAVLIGFCIFLKFYNVEKARTVAFSVLVFSQLFHAFNFRVGKKNLFTKEIFKNRMLILAFLVSFLLQMLILYLPWTGYIFKTFPLDFKNLIFVIFLSLMPVYLINLWRRKVER